MNMYNIKIPKNNSGSMLIIVLVFTTIFALVSLVLGSLVNSQFKLSTRKIAWNKSIQVAEAGVNYYRWHLAHSPTDYYDGNDEATSPGPYVHDYNDPQGSTIGQFSLEITPPSECSNRVVIESTGWTNDYPGIQRKVRVTYGKQSLAQFSFISNSSFWLKSNEELHGHIHSNGGIRHEGLVDSLTTSAQENYWCGYQEGCTSNPSDPLAEMPGIWGSGEDQSLRQFPVSNIDFASITANLATLKTIADEQLMCSATEDCFFPQQGLGYHITFIDDGTFEVRRVTQKQNNVWAWDGYDWVRRSDDIKNQSSVIDTYTLPSSCAIIFVEDDVWVDGTVKGSVTLVAAKLPVSPGNSPDIIINDDLVYLDKDGDNSLGLISQQDIIIPFYGYPTYSDTLEDLEINGVLLAQNGHVMRMHYDPTWPSYHLNDSLVIYGAVISNTMRKWSWQSSEGGPYVSGYQNTDITYDSNLTYNPPPGFPTTGDYQFITWEEVTEK